MGSRQQLFCFGVGLTWLGAANVGPRVLFGFGVWNLFKTGLVGLFGLGRLLFPPLLVGRLLVLPAFSGPCQPLSMGCACQQCDRHNC